MKLAILSQANQETGKVNLPVQFDEEVRPDLIQRAVLAIQSNNRQPYGNMPMAGKRASARISKRRRDYRTCYGHGISRTPRKIVSKRGRRLNWIGAFAPNTVGGRRAHPPKASRIWEQKINDKERRKAIRSAISATVNKDYFAKKSTPPNYPFILEKSFESMDKTNKVIESLQKLGLTAELERSSKKTFRSGHGKLRGRPYQKRKGALIVVSADCRLMHSARNIPGVDIVEVKKLNAELLAPGAEPGRITLFTQSAVEMMEKEKIFM